MVHKRKQKEKDFQTKLFELLKHEMIKTEKGIIEEESQKGGDKQAVRSSKVLLKGVKKAKNMDDLVEIYGYDYLKDVLTGGI